jgi:putative ABC transport system permease protein
MPVLVRIAFRNLLEHKSKTLIIGILLALGVIILIVGNAFMDTAAKGVKDTFIANYTGDVFISGKSTNGVVSLFGVQAAGGQETTPTLPYYDKILEKLRGMPQVQGMAGQVTGFALASLKDSDSQTFALLFGVDPAEYRKLFDGAQAAEGHFLQPGEEGIVVSKSSLDRFSKDLGKTVKVGDTILLTGMGKAGFKIRSVPIVGMVKYPLESEATDFITYVDVNTLRILQGMTLGNDEDTPVTQDQKQLLAESDESAMFGSEEVVTSQAAPKTAAPKPAAAKAPAPRPQSVVDTGAWHFELVRLHDPAQAPEVAAGLNQWFAKEDIDAHAGDWKAAAGPFAQSIDVVRIVFDVAIIIVAVVAIIIMMNTLVISVIERTGEIGTMRALGAQRGYIRRMFLIETLAIAIVFGLVGMALGFGIIGGLNAAKIAASNSFLKILFAGNVLHAAVNPMSVVSSLVLVMLVAVIAHLYPVSIALKIEPVRAMQTE